MSFYLTLVLETDPTFIKSSINILLSEKVSNDIKRLSWSSSEIILLNLLHKNVGKAKCFWWNIHVLLFIEILIKYSECFVTEIMEFAYKLVLFVL